MSVTLGDDLFMKQYEATLILISQLQQKDNTIEQLVNQLNALTQDVAVEDTKKEKVKDGATGN